MARYKCPKCSVSYCSIDCYKNHNGGASDCTEVFYQDRMSRVLNLETRAKRDEFHRVLSRIRGQEHYSTHEDEPKYNQKELLELLDHLDNDDELKLSNYLQQRPNLTTEVDSSLRRGELSEWMLEPWHPWWRVELATTALTDEQGDLRLKSEDEGVLDNLDARLLEIPPFQVLRPQGKDIPRQLRYNILEILFSVVSTFALFHGSKNAKEVPVEASQYLIELSKVLSKDVRYESVQEVLMLVSEAQKCLHAPFSYAMLKSHFEDLAIILGNRRFIGKALLEASDILFAALQTEVKDKAFQKSLQKCQRKLKFYLSWTLDVNTSNFEGLTDEIEAWCVDWAPLKVYDRLI
jgi:hypothetical protein